MSISSSGVGGRDKPRLVLGRRGHDALLQEQPEKPGEVAVGVSVVSANFLAGVAPEEWAERPSKAADRHGDAVTVGRFLYPLSQHGPQAFEPGVKLGILQRLQASQTRSHGQRVSRQGAVLIHPAQRRDDLHDLPPAAVRSDRQAAADHLAQGVQVGLQAEELVRSNRSENGTR